MWMIRGTGVQRGNEMIIKNVVRKVSVKEFT